ncbi:hypothetical protein SAMN05216294_2952 [Flagellimonas zhangzhouensis]|nr:hypothetical protein SAMN05216294_2952 [Allomuricauda zhangzhouensis]
MNSEVSFGQQSKCDGIFSLDTVPGNTSDNSSKEFIYNP